MRAAPVIRADKPTKAMNTSGLNSDLPPRPRSYVPVSGHQQTAEKAPSQYLTAFQRKLLQKHLAQNKLPEKYLKRVQIMLLADEGYAQTEICRRLGCCQATARHWMAIAQSGQAHAWFDSTMGRPKTVDEAYLNRLQELVERSPREYGYVFRRWTAGWLNRHLAKEFDIQVSDRHINRLLKQMGLSTRPQPTCEIDSGPASLTLSTQEPVEEGDRSDKIAIRDLQPLSDVKPTASIQLASIPANLNPLNKESKIYGAISGGYALLSRTQSPSRDRYFRGTAASVS